MKGKEGQYVRLTTLPPSCADCLEIWELQPSGTLRVCPGLNVIATFTFYISCLSVFRQGSIPRFKGCTRLRASLSEHGSKAASQISCSDKKSNDRQIPKKKILSVKSIFSYTQKTTDWERTKTNYNQRREI